MIFAVETAHKLSNGNFLSAAVAEHARAVVFNVARALSGRAEQQQKTTAGLRCIRFGVGHALSTRRTVQTTAHLYKGGHGRAARCAHKAAVMKRALVGHQTGLGHVNIRAAPTRQSAVDVQRRHVLPCARFAWRALAVTIARVGQDQVLAAQVLLAQITLDLAPIALWAALGNRKRALIYQLDATADARQAGTMVQLALGRFHAHVGGFDQCIALDTHSQRASRLTLRRIRSGCVVGNGIFFEIASTSRSISSSSYKIKRVDVVDLNSIVAPPPKPTLARLPAFDSAS